MNGLLFIRHAETDLAGAFCGHTDPPVNTRGHQQIRDLIQRLAHESIDSIYSSDLTRARTTANALANASGSPVRVSAVWREIHFGEWEGLTWREIELRDPAVAKRWTEAFPHLPAPGGELFAHFQARVRAEVDRLLLLAQGKRLVVITHAGVMRLVLEAYCGYTSGQAWEQTASYCCFFNCAASSLPFPGQVPVSNRPPRVEDFAMDALNPEISSSSHWQDHSRHNGRDPRTRT